MFNDESIDAFNNRLTIDPTQLGKLTAAQQDRIRHYGSQAEALLKNRDLAMFVHHFKFSMLDELSSIRGHQADDNTRRVAISNELAGLDNFVSSLKRAVYYKNKLGNTEVPNS